MYYSNGVYTVLLLFFINNCFSQTHYTNVEWVDKTPEMGSSYYRSSSIVDNGYLYVTTNSLNSTGSHTDIFTIKYDENGDTLWSKTYNGNADGDDYGIDLTEFGDYIYVTGTAEDTASDYDFIVLVYHKSNGNLEWSYKWDGQESGIDIPADIIVDDNENTYICGGTEDSFGYSDFGIIRLDPGGNLDWDRYYDDNELYDAASELEFLENGDLCVTGGSNYSSGVWNIVVLELDPNDGSSVAESQSTSSNVAFVEVTAMTSDSSNNIYVTGYTDNTGRDVHTVKFDSTLSEEWVVDYDGGNEDEGRDIAVDTDGNVYVVGHTQISSSEYNFLTLKYNSSGTLIWDEEYGNVEDSEQARGEAIELDNDEDLFVTGTVIQGNRESIDLLKYNSSGEIKLHKSIYSDSTDYNAFDMNIDGQTIYITGLAKTIGAENLSVAKLSVFENDVTVVEDTAGYQSRIDGELVIRFNPNYLDSSNVDNIGMIHGELSDFLKTSALDSLDALTGEDMSRYKVIKVHPNLTTNDTIAIGHLGDTVQLPPMFSTFIVLIDESLNDTSFLEKIKDAVPYVNAASFNGYFKLAATANDTEYINGNSAGLTSATAYPDANINIELAWDYATGTDKVVVGVFDSGIHNSHGDISNGSFSSSSVSSGYDYVNNYSITTVANPDDYGHGSAVAGIIAAWRNNNSGMAGVAGGDSLGGVTVHDMKLFMADTSSTCNLTGTIFASAAQMQQAIEEGGLANGDIEVPQRIMNHSWEGNYSDPFIREALILVYDLDVVTVFASGNGSFSLAPCTDYGSYPSMWKDNFIMRVGANDTTGARAEFSKCGRNLDFIAPGTIELYETLDNSGNLNTDTLDHPNPACNGGALNGTSFAAPHVTGVAALMLSYANEKNFELSHEDCEELMQMYATDIIDSNNVAGYDDETGWGRINAGAIFDSIQYPDFRIEHLNFTINTSNAIAEDTITACMEQNLFGLTGVADVVRWKVESSNTHTLPYGYNLITGWARGSASDIYGEMTGSTATSNACFPYTCGNCNYFPDVPAPLLDSASLSPTNATMTGYIYEFVDSSMSTVGWYPYDTSSTAKFAYTLYLDQSDVGIAENGKSDFDIYPNPANSSVTIQFNSDYNSNSSIHLYSLTGELVKTIAENKEINSSIPVTFSINDLSDGLYFVVVRSSNDQFIRKLVVNRK
ncbi:MAG: S8 family serine peptidase [Crocinitomicaceae bacterium]